MKNSNQTGHSDDSMQRSGTQYRILLVVIADPTLSWGKELEIITATHHCAVISDHSMQWDRIQRAGADAEYEIVHFVCHADTQGLHLGTEIVESERIVNLVKSCKAKLVFLNCCSAAQFGQKLVDDSVGAVICYNTDIIDTKALSIATEFYRYLAEGYDIKTSYNESKLNDGSLMFISNGKYAQAEYNHFLHDIELAADRFNIFFKVIVWLIILQLVITSIGWSLTLWMYWM